MILSRNELFTAVNNFPSGNTGTTRNSGINWCNLIDYWDYFSPLAAIAFINRKYVINGRNINRFIIPSVYKKQSAKLINIYVIYVYFNL